MTARACALYVSVVLLGFPAAADEDLGKRWEERHEFDNRYEGRPEVPVSKPDLELLSFVGYFQDLDRDVELQVLFYQSRATATATVFAQHLEDRKRYWMKSKPGSWEVDRWNRFGPWPTRDVIDDDGIDGWDLGVYVDLGSQDEILIAPAFVYHSEPPSDVDAYTLQLRPNQSLTRLETTVTRAAEEAPEALLEQRQLRPVRAGEVIELDLQAAELPETWLRVEVVGKIKNRTDKARFEMRFFHRAKVAPPR